MEIKIGCVNVEECEWMRRKIIENKIMVWPFLIGCGGVRCRTEEQTRSE